MLRNDQLAQALKETKAVIHQLLAEKPRVLVAIDGRCAAGKTTFAEALGKEFFCDVVHMDDFFLRPEQRTEERRKKPGENVDYERVLEEVLLPYDRKRKIIYRPFDCHTMSLKEPVQILHGQVLIVEGAYSGHEKLWPRYDLHIFLDVESESQMKRIVLRNGEQAAKHFEELWIPLEERYFAAFQIKERSDICFKFTDF